MLRLEHHTDTTRDPVAFARWLDVALLVATVPVLLLAGLPALGVLAGAAAWLVQRAIGYAMEARAKLTTDPRNFAGLMLASSMARAWLVGLTILAVGLAGEREDGLAAAVLVLAAYTVYFVLSLILRPKRKSSQS